MQPIEDRLVRRTDLVRLGLQLLHHQAGDAARDGLGLGGERHLEFSACDRKQPAVDVGGGGGDDLLAHRTPLLDLGRVLL